MPSLPFCHFFSLFGHFLNYVIFVVFVIFHILSLFVFFPILSFSYFFVTFDLFCDIGEIHKKNWNYFMSDFQTLCWNWASSVFSSIVKVKSPARTQRPTWLNSWWLLTEFRTSGNKCKKTSPRSPPTAKLRRLLSFMIYFCVHLIFALTSTSTTWSDKLT